MITADYKCHDCGKVQAFNIETHGRIKKCRGCGSDNIWRLAWSEGTLPKGVDDGRQVQEM
ncbi:MAG: hypothetical protein GY861_17090 [bacterium]|nr:hypothetical protein [bacterium]